MELCSKGKDSDKVFNLRYVVITVYYGSGNSNVRINLQFLNN